jgi:hypothetical protein
MDAAVTPGAAPAAPPVPALTAPAPADDDDDDDDVPSLMATALSAAVSILSLDDWRATIPTSQGRSASARGAVIHTLRM